MGTSVPARPEYCRERRGEPVSPPDGGGGKRTRTADPLRAKQVLSQLSYTPDVQKYGPG